MDSTKNSSPNITKGRLFHSKVLYRDELFTAQSGNRYHHFLSFLSDNCTIVFNDGTTKKPSEGAIVYIAPDTPYKITCIDDRVPKVIGVGCFGCLSDTLSLSCSAFSNHITVRPNAVDLFNTLLNQIREDDGTLEETNRIASIFFQLMVEIVFSPTYIVESKPAALAQKIKTYIEENIDTNISVTSISRHFYLSETHVIRIFKERFGETPKQYILKCKINASKLLLLDTSLQIKEIAMTYHFADSYHFSHTFKRFTGISPEKYRMREVERK